MNDRLRRHRKAAAVLASLAIAATISVVAPATASAREAKKAPTSTVSVVTPGTASGGTKHANDWTW